MKFRWDFGHCRNLDFEPRLTPLADETLLSAKASTMKKPPDLNVFPFTSKTSKRIVRVATMRTASDLAVGAL
jgi:hypothetical protein